MPHSPASIIKAANASLLENGNVDVVAEFFSPRYRAHVTDGDVTGGHAAVKKIVTMYRGAFANMKAEVEILVTAGDRIAWQRTVRGKHVGSFKGFPATGRRIVWRDMVVSRISKGLIAEDWFITDLAEQLLLGRKRR